MGAGCRLLPPAALKLGRCGAGVTFSRLLFGFRPEYDYYCPECTPPACPSSSATGNVNGAFNCVVEEPPGGEYTPISGAATYTLCAADTDKNETRFERQLEDMRIRYFFDTWSGDTGWVVLLGLETRVVLGCLPWSLRPSCSHSAAVMHCTDLLSPISYLISPIS